MGLFRRRASTHYGDCPRCGHDWREHPGGEFDSNPEVCGECLDEVTHGTRPAGAEPPCVVGAPPPPET